jgi:hypothetical protein
MKKLMFVLTAVLFTVSSMLAVKALTEARIYLNPGHGSWGPDDRPAATIPYPNLASTGRPDTCGFYESNTNLWKVLHLGAVLEQMGVKPANIMFSRVKNGPYPYAGKVAGYQEFNRPLSEISGEVEANNMDMFLSVHSNGAPDDFTNFTLFLYRGKDGEGGDSVPTSRAMAKTVWPFMLTNEIDPTTSYSSTNVNIRGDMDFYGDYDTVVNVYSHKAYTGYLGVLKHGVPGFLSEGYMHTYQPARHRALNPDYCGQEGMRLARGIAAYFGSDGLTTGAIMGTVKDMNTRIVNKVFQYLPETNDQWLPLNGAKVNLYKGGSLVRTYNVDSLYNGVFVFEGLQPGDDYTLDATVEGYDSLTSFYKAPISVKADATSYSMLLLQKTGYVPPVGTYANYPDPQQDSYLGIAAKYNMKRSFLDKNLTVLNGKTVRRTILRGDTLLALALDPDNTPHVYFFNAKNQTFVKEISTAGLLESQLKLSDIALTADYSLIGCNYGKNQYDSTYVATGEKRGALHIYRWADFDSAPVEWFSTLNSGNFYTAMVGQTLAVSGTVKECKILSTAKSATGTSIRPVYMAVVDSAMVAAVHNKTAFSTTNVGEDYQLKVSPRSEDNFVIDGSLIAPVEFAPQGAAASNVAVVGSMSTDVIPASAKGADYFKYAKHSLMAAPVTDENAKNVGIKLFDVTNGFDAANLIATTNTDITADSAVYTMAGGVVNNADITVLLVRDTTITKFTTQNTAQPQVRRIFAYDLKSTLFDDNHYQFSYKCNVSPNEAQIVFYDEEGAEVGSIDNVAFSEASTAVVPMSDIPGEVGQKLTWGVRLTGDPVANIAQVNDQTAPFTYTRATGVISDDDPESDYFGRVYVSNYNKTNAAVRGLYAYNPDWTRISDNPFQGNANFGSPYRLGIDSNHKIYVADWSDNLSGIRIADPADLTADFADFFKGCTRNSSSGQFTNSDGTVVGGSVSGLCITGSGANTVLYTIAEDVLGATSGKGNVIAAYNIGSSDGIASNWNVAPSSIIDVGATELNGNCSIVPDENHDGFWVSQLRAASQNTAEVPALIFVTKDGKIQYNSSVIFDTFSGCGGAGFALTPDGKTLIINDATDEFLFYDVTWNGNVPTLTYKYKYTHSIGDPTYYHSVFQMHFDYAGNLLASGAYLGMFSLPTENNTCTTPAKKSLTVIKKASGVNSVLNDAAVRLSVYPNPTTGIINITSPEPVKVVNVFNSTGAVVAHSTQSSVDLSGLTNGIYFVKVNNLNTVKVVKH